METSTLRPHETNYQLDSWWSEVSGILATNIGCGVGIQPSFDCLVLYLIELRAPRNTCLLLSL